jgi:hypothetical protein
MEARMKIDTPRTDGANTSSFFSDIIDTLTERGRALLGRKASGAIPQLDLVALGELLLSRRGEASGVALAQTLLASYNTATDPVRLDFLCALAERFGPSKSQIEHTIERLCGAITAVLLAKTRLLLMSTATAQESCSRTVYFKLEITRRVASNAPHRTQRRDIGSPNPKAIFQPVRVCRLLLDPGSSMAWTGI